MHGRRNGMLDMALDHPAGFHLAQRLDQHFLRYPWQRSMQRSGTRDAPMPSMECMENHAGPFSRENFQDASGRTVLAPLLFI